MGVRVFDLTAVAASCDPAYSDNLVGLAIATTKTFRLDLGDYWHQFGLLQITILTASALGAAVMNIRGDNVDGGALPADTLVSYNAAMNLVKVADGTTAALITASLNGQLTQTVRPIGRYVYFNIQNGGTAQDIRLKTVAYQS